MTNDRRSNETLGLLNKALGTIKLEEGRNVSGGRKLSILEQNRLALKYIDFREDNIIKQGIKNSKMIAAGGKTKQIAILEK